MEEAGLIVIGPGQAGRQPGQEHGATRDGCAFEEAPATDATRQFS